MKLVTNLELYCQAAVAYHANMQSDCKSLILSSGIMSDFVTFILKMKVLMKGRLFLNSVQQCNKNKFQEKKKGFKGASITRS